MLNSWTAPLARVPPDKITGVSIIENHLMKILQTEAHNHKNKLYSKVELESLEQP